MTRGILNNIPKSESSQGNRKGKTSQKPSQMGIARIVWGGERRNGGWRRWCEVFSMWHQNVKYSHQWENYREVEHFLTITGIQKWDELCWKVINSSSLEMFKKMTTCQGYRKEASLVRSLDSHLVVRPTQAGSWLRSRPRLGVWFSSSVWNPENLCWETTGPDQWTPRWREEWRGQLLHIYIFI